MKKQFATKRKIWRAPKIERLAANLAAMPGIGTNSEGIDTNTS